MKYLFYQRGTLNGKVVQGFITFANSKKQALQLINQLNKSLSNNPNLKQVLDFTYPLKEHLKNVKTWEKEQQEKEFERLDKHNGLENAKNIVYTNKYLTVIKTK